MLLALVSGCYRHGALLGAVIGTSIVTAAIVIMALLAMRTAQRADRRGRRPCGRWPPRLREAAAVRRSCAARSAGETETKRGLDVKKGRVWVSYSESAFIARRFALPDGMEENIAGIPALVDAALCKGTAGER